MERFIGWKEITQKTRMSRETIKRKVKIGFPLRRIGEHGAVFVFASELKDWLQRQEYKNHENLSIFERI